MTRLAVLLACLTAGACAHNPPEYRGRVRVESAQLVAVNPDVKTVADADQPIFFSGGFFWLFRDGGWWRAERATSERWVRIYEPPVPVQQITNPYAFTNYRDHAGTQTAARETTQTPAAPAALQRELARPTKDDHRTDPPTPTAGDAAADPNAPTTVDTPAF